MSAIPGSFPSSRRIHRLAPARLGWALLNGVQALYTPLPLPKGEASGARDALAQQAQYAVAEALQALRGDEVRAHGTTS